MSHLVISESGRSVSKLEIERFEREIDALLPSAYVDFLVKYNGGSPSPSCFVTKDVEVEVRRFFSIDESRPDGLQSERKFLIDELPREVIPIAVDWGGNRICLGVNGIVKDHVYFWDHEAEVGEALIKLSSSFQKFLEEFRDS